MHCLLDGTWASSPAIIRGMSRREFPDGAGQVAIVPEIAVNVLQAEFKVLGFFSDLCQGEIAGYLYCIKAHGAKTPFRGESQMDKILGVDMNHMTAYGIHGTGICPHHDRAHCERGRRQQHFLSRGNGIEGDKFWLDDLLEIRNLVLKKDIMVNQPVPVILNADEIFKAQRQPAPWVGLELGQVDEKIAFGNRLGDKDRLAEVFFSFQFKGELTRLIKEICLDLLLFYSLRVTCHLETKPGGNGDAGPFPHGYLLGVLGHFFRSRYHAVKEFRSRKCMGKYFRMGNYATGIP